MKNIIQDYINKGYHKIDVVLKDNQKIYTLYKETDFIKKTITCTLDKIIEKRYVYTKKFQQHCQDFLDDAPNAINGKQAMLDKFGHEMEDHEIQRYKNDIQYLEKCTLNDVISSMKPTAIADKRIYQVDPLIPLFFSHIEEGQLTLSNQSEKAIIISENGIIDLDFRKKNVGRVEIKYNNQNTILSTRALAPVSYNKIEARILTDLGAKSMTNYVQYKNLSSFANSKNIRNLINEIAKNTFDSRWNVNEIVKYAAINLADEYADIEIAPEFYNNKKISLRKDLYRYVTQVDFESVLNYLLTFKEDWNKIVPERPTYKKKSSTTIHTSRFYENYSEDYDILNTEENLHYEAEYLRREIEDDITSIDDVSFYYNDDDADDYY